MYYNLFIADYKITTLLLFWLHNERKNFSQRVIVTISPLWYAKKNIQ